MAVAIALTAERTLIQNWMSHAKAPVAPANYKDPVKITAYIEDKLASMESELREESSRLTEINNVRAAFPCHKLFISSEDDTPCGGEDFVGSPNFQALTILLATAIADKDTVYVFGKDADIILHKLYSPTLEKSRYVWWKGGVTMFPNYYNSVRSALLLGTLPVVYKSYASLLFTKKDRESLLLDTLEDYSSKYESDINLLQEGLNKSCLFEPLTKPVAICPLGMSDSKDSIKKESVEVSDVG